MDTTVDAQEGEAMAYTTRGELAREVEAILERGWTLESEAAVLGEILGDDTGDGISPDALFESLMAGSSVAPGRAEIVAFPGDLLSSELQPGDVLIRIAPGERGLGHVALLTSGELLPARVLAGRGVSPESYLPGRYARVIEGGAVPHMDSDSAARRVTDASGRLPLDQMIIRLGPGVLVEAETEAETESEIETFETETFETETFEPERFEPERFEPERFEPVSQEMPDEELADAASYPAIDVDDTDIGDWEDDAESAASEAADAAALGRQIRQRAPNGVAVAIYGTDEARFKDDALKWAAREDALGIADKGKRLVPHEMRLGRPIPGAKKLEDIITALGGAITTALSTNAKTLQVEPLVFGPEARIRTLVLFTHGDFNWVGVCQEIDSKELARIVKVIAPNLAPDVRIMIYGCSAARGSKEIEGEWRVSSMTRGGKDSFCGVLRDALFDEGNTKAEVWGHTEVGGPTRNFTLRRFRGVDGKGAEGVPFAGEIVFGASERKLARDQVEAHVIGLAFDISSVSLADLHAKADAEVTGAMYDSYSQQTIVKKINGNKDYSDRLKLQGVSLGEMAPFYPEEVTSIVRDYWTSKYWTTSRQKTVAKKVATDLRLKKSTTPAPVGP